MRIFPVKLLKWFILPLLVLAWLPEAIDLIAWQFKQTDAIGDFGVMWPLLVAVPVTVLSAVLLILVIGMRLLKKRQHSP